MPYTSVTLASAAASTPINLNWRSGNSVALQVTTNTSSGTGDFTVQYTLNDLQLVGGTSLATWSNLSSFNGLTFPTTGNQGVHFNSSLITGDGVLINFLVSPAAVRLNSTGLSSNTLTLTALQGD